MKKSWRWHLGSKSNSFEQWLLSRRAIPIIRAVPRGRYWLYDVQRFGGDRKPPVIFDVGANVGQTLRALLRYFPESSITCFEPVERTFGTLRSGFGSHGNVTFVQSALGSAPGIREIELRSDSELNTLVEARTQGSILSGKRETITIETLDRHCHSRNIQSINVLKMDVQGWEMEVLRGAERLLLGNAIQFIYSEVAFRRHDHEMQHFAELNDYLEAAGYFLNGFYQPYRWGRSSEFLGFSNALFMNPSFVARGRQ